MRRNDIVRTTIDTWSDAQGVGYNGQWCLYGAAREDIDADCKAHERLALASCQTIPSARTGYTPARMALRRLLLPHDL